MVRPIHNGGGVTAHHHGPRVHFSPVVSQLRYKEQQGCLRPVRRRNLDTNSAVSNDNNKEGGGRVRVHEIILPCPTVQKVETQEQEQQLLSVNSELTTSSQQQLKRMEVNGHNSTHLARKNLGQRTDFGQNSIEPGHRSIDFDRSRIDFGHSVELDQSALTCHSQPDYGRNNKRVTSSANGELGDHVPDVSSYGTALPLRTSDSINRSARTVYGYEYYGYTYGLPSPSTIQRTSLPFHQTLTSEFCNLNGRYSCCSSASSASQQQQVRQQRQAHDASLAANVVVECNECDYLAAQSFNTSLPCCPEKLQESKEFVPDNPKRKSKKFNFLHKLSFRKLTSRSSGGQSSWKKSKKASRSASDASQVVSLSSWPSIKGVVVSSNNTLDSPVLTSCTTCAELCHSGRNKSKARNVTPVHLSSSSSASSKEDKTNRCEELNGIRNGVNGAVYFPVEDNNCLYTHRHHQEESLAVKNKSEPSGTSVICGDNSPAVPTWDTRSFNRRYHHHHPHRLQDPNETIVSVSAAQDTSISQQIRLSSPSKAKNIQTNADERKVPGSTVEPRRISSSAFDKICDTHDSVRTSKNVATSPIHHLSAFHALNLPVIQKVGTDREESFEPAPTPPPRPRRKRSNASLNQQPDQDSLGNTDELSANVDKILDEIANLELECLSMELYANLLGGRSKDHLDEGSNSKMKSPLASKRAERVNRMEFGDEEGGGRQEAAEWLEETVKRTSSSSISPFGKPPLPPSAGRQNTSAIRQQFLTEDLTTGKEEVDRTGRGTDLDVKLLKFRLQLYRSREELAKSHPNLEEMEDLVRSSMVIDRSRSQRTTLPLSVYDGGSLSSRSGKPEIPPATPLHTATHISSSSSSSPPGQFLEQQEYIRLTPDPVTSEKERCRAEEWSRLVSQINRRNNSNTKSTSCGGDHNGNVAGQAQYSAIVETDLDAGTSREIVDGRTSERQLYLQTYGHEQYDDEWCDDVFQQRQQQENQVNDGESRNRPRNGRKSRNLPLSVYPDHDGQLSYSLNEKTRSLLNLGSPTTMSSHREKSATLTPMSSAQVTVEGSLSVSTASDERARSMEFLLENSDKNSHLRPPENKLMMRQENRQLSEHEVRIQRSLNKLNVPDWYKSYAESGGGGGTSGGGVSGGGTSGSKSKIFGSGTGLAGGWTGLSSSKTSSLTSLQSTGRYSGRTHFSRLRSTGTASTGGRSSRESLMSPSSTASASPSPYYERSSFTYGMPYALTRFASARMSCGASPASLSPSPSPVGGTGGSSTSTPVSSVPLSRHHSYSKTPYLGWRSQERLNTKQMYRTPAERLAADLLAQKSRTSSPTTTVSSVASGSTTKDEDRLSDTPSKESSPKKETASASDLSLNNSEESNSHKLNRVRSSIKAVSNAIVDYVNETKPLDDGMNGGTSPRRGFVWLETAFVGTKPIDSPGTPDTPTVIMTSSRQLTGTDSGSSSTIGGGTRPRNVFRFEDDHHLRTSSPSRTAPAASAASSTLSSSYNDSSLSKSAAKNNGTSATATTTSASTYNPYHSRNEQMEERSNSSSVSSPTLDDILDSLLALRRPHKKIKPRGHVRDPVPLPPSQLDPTPVSDWQERMNQPVLDVLYFPVTDDFFPGTTTTTIVQSSQSNTSANDYHRNNSFNMTSSSTTTVTTTHGYNDSNNVASNEDAGQALSSRTDNEPSNYMSNSIISKADNSRAEQERVNAENKSNSQIESTQLGLSGHIKSIDQDEEDPMENHEEAAFGIPTEICTATASSISSAAVNAIASLNDSNPPTPARHRRVSFDLDTSEKDEKSSSRSARRDESVGGAIHCRNSKCIKTATGLEARREFKTCHNCNAYYCSRECRRAHWEKHKKVCMQSRVGALCKQIINHVKEDSFVVSQLSSVARRGFLAKGRGCVKLFFSSPDRAERFLTGGLPELPEPWYIPCGDILPEEMGAQIFAELSDQCRTYNGDNRFVLYVSVCVVNEVPTSGAVKWEREMISRSAKLRLLLPRNYEETQMHHQAASPAHLFPDEPAVPVLSPDKSSENVPPPPPPHGSDNDTLILRSVPAPTTRQLTRSEDKRLREVSFANIQKQLVERGVDLKRTFPDIYNKLGNYVEYDEPFLPVTIYPKNNKTGRQFVCVIMPDPSSNHHAHEDYNTGSPGSSSSSRNVETVNISESSYDLT